MTNTLNNYFKQFLVPQSDFFSELQPISKSWHTDFRAGVLVLVQKLNELQAPCYSVYLQESNNFSSQLTM